MDKVNNLELRKRLNQIQDKRIIYLLEYIVHLTLENKMPKTQVELLEQIANDLIEIKKLEHEE